MYTDIDPIGYTPSHCRTHNQADEFTSCQFCQLESEAVCSECGPAKNNEEGVRIECEQDEKRSPGMHPELVDLYWFVCPCGEESEQFTSVTALRHLTDWVE